MKICDLTQIYSPMGGGVRSYLQAKREFIREETTHQHLTIIPGERTEQLEDGPTKLWTVKGPLVNSTSRYRWMTDLPSVLRILDQERPEVVEAGDPYHAALLSRNWANRRGAKFYMFYHSHFPDAILRTVLKFAGMWPRSAVERFAGDYLRNLSESGRGVFVASQHLVKILNRWGVRRLIHLPLGVNTRIFHPAHETSQSDIRKKLGLPTGEPILLYVGRFSPDKDTAMLLRTWRKLGEIMKGKWTGIMVGDGQMSSEVERFTRSHPHIRRVSFIHNQEALADWYRSADLFIHPGRWETFGLVLLEAQACGLPVLSFLGGAMSEQAANLEGWPNEKDSNTFAEAVAMKLTQQKEKDRRQASEFVLRNFSWHKTFQLQMKVYESET